MPALNNSFTLNIGDKIMSLGEFQWTLDEFEDNPLFVSHGDTGIVTGIDYDSKRIEIHWDKDKNPQPKKSLSFEEESKLKKLQ